MAEIYELPKAASNGDMTCTRRSSMAQNDKEEETILFPRQPALFRGLNSILQLLSEANFLSTSYSQTTVSLSRYKQTRSDQLRQRQDDSGEHSQTDHKYENTTSPTPNPIFNRKYTPWVAPTPSSSNILNHIHSFSNAFAHTYQHSLKHQHSNKHTRTHTLNQIRSTRNMGMGLALDVRGAYVFHGCCGFGLSFTVIGDC